MSSRADYDPNVAIAAGGNLGGNAPTSGGGFDLASLAPILGGASFLTNLLFGGINAAQQRKQQGENAALGIMQSAGQQPIQAQSSLQSKTAQPTMVQQDQDAASFVRSLVQNKHQKDASALNSVESGIGSALGLASLALPFL